MDKNSKIKRFQRWLARRGLISSVWLFEKLPYPVIKQITKVFLWIGFKFTLRHRRVAEESLRIAFGDEKTEEERQDIIKKCFSGVGRGMIELFYFMARPQQLAKKMTVVGKENLDEAFKSGNGVIAVTAHFGNFPLMMLFFAEIGYDVNCIMRHTRDPEFDQYLYTRREEKGLKSIYTKPRRESVTRSLKALRRNALLFIPIDQNFGGSGGVFVDFFGRKAATAPGPAVFASRTGASIIPMFIVREGEDDHKVIIEKPVVLDKAGDDKESIRENMAKVTAIVEKYIRKYPHEWAWMHRRWKTEEENPGAPEHSSTSHQ